MRVPEFAVAIGTAEAADVKHLLVGKEPFHGVHGLLTPNTGFLHWQLEFLQGERKFVNWKTHQLLGTWREFMHSFLSSLELQRVTL